MAISPKPKSSRSQDPKGVDIDTLIQRGGSVAGHASSILSTDKAVEKKIVSVVLRVPQTILQQIDASLGTRPVRVPRHTWLMEALVEKLTREQQSKEE